MLLGDVDKYRTNSTISHIRRAITICHLEIKNANAVLSVLGRQWHCVTSRKGAGSFPYGSIRIFNLRNPSGRTLAVRSTQPPKKKMNTKDTC